MNLRLKRSQKVYSAGHRVPAGSAIWRHLQEQGFTALVGADSADVDLRDRQGTLAVFSRERPDVIIDAAAKVGGILSNSTYPADFLSDNLRIQVNVMDAAKETGVERLLFRGSSCVYRKLAEQPIKESSLLTENCGSADPINVGVGQDVTIRDLAEIVADVAGYSGTLVQDTTKPDGTPRKLLDVRRINDLGWNAMVPLGEGIASTYHWFLDHRSAIRG